MERSFDDRELENLLRGGEVDSSLAPVARLLDDVRDELVRAVPDDVADAHLAAMLAVAPHPQRSVEVSTPSSAQAKRTGRRRQRSHRAAVFAACVGMTMAYGGLAAAGALPTVPATSVATHIGGWFGARFSPTHATPAGTAVVPGHSNGKKPATSPPAEPQRRAHVSVSTPRAPGDSASVSTDPAGHSTGKATSATAPGQTKTTTTATTTPTSSPGNSGNGSNGSSGSHSNGGGGANAGGTPPGTAPGKTTNSTTPADTAPGKTTNSTTPANTAPRTTTSTTTKGSHGNHGNAPTDASPSSQGDNHGAATGQP